MKLSEKIKDYRKKENLTQEMLAKKLFVSRQAVSKWEQDLGYPDLNCLTNLSKIMNTSIDQLLSNEETKFLSIDSSTKIKKTNQIFAAFSITLSILFISIVIFLIVILGPEKLEQESNEQPNEQPQFRGLVGFYIDVNEQDGNFSLNTPNKEDIYFYKARTGEYLKNGIFDDTISITQNNDKTSWLKANCNIYIDATFSINYTIYEVIDTTNGLETKEYSKVDKSTLLKANSPSIKYTMVDYVVKEGSLVGTIFSPKIIHTKEVIKIRIIQYNDYNYKNILSDQYIDALEGTFYLDLNMNSCIIYEIVLIDGVETANSNVHAYNIKLFSTIKSIPKVNNYGYVSNRVKLKITCIY